MNYSRIQNILFLIVLIFGLVNCESTSGPEEIVEYAPGQVIVGFVDTVSYQFAIDFCKTENLEILKFDLGHNFWAVADSNNFKYYQGIFSNDSTVSYINELFSNSSNDTLLITITIKGVNNLEHDIENLNLVGLTVYKTHVHPHYVLVKTPINMEQYFINKLTKYNFVKYAELNYISHIN